MIKRFTFVSLVLCNIGCAAGGIITVPPQPTPQVHVWAKTILTVKVVPAAATVMVNGQSWATRPDGTIVEEFPNLDLAVTASAPGYRTSEPVTLLWPHPERRTLTITLEPIAAPAPAQVDWCGTKTESQLRDIRADMGGVRLSITLSERGGNYLFTPMYPAYTAEQRAIIRREYKARGYTHFAVGAIADKYPGLASYDHRANPAAYEAMLEELWRDDLIPYVWLMVDGPYNVTDSPGNLDNPIDFAKVEAGLTPIYQRPAMQRLVCVTVAGWEVTDNQWVKTKARALQLAEWQARVTPRAFHLWHSAADNGAPCNYDEDGEGCERSTWLALSRFLHGYYYQTGNAGGWNMTKYDSTKHSDRVRAFTENLQYEADRFRGDRYQLGGVLGADGKPMDVIMGEYSAYFELPWVDRESEDWGREWGRLAMTVPGVRGFGDGGPR